MFYFWEEGSSSGVPHLEEGPESLFELVLGHVDLLLAEAHEAAGAQRGLQPVRALQEGRLRDDLADVHHVRRGLLLGVLQRHQLPTELNQRGGGVKPAGTVITTFLKRPRGTHGERGSDGSPDPLGGLLQRVDGQRRGGRLGQLQRGQSLPGAEGIHVPKRVADLYQKRQSSGWRERKRKHAQHLKTAAKYQFMQILKLQSLRLLTLVRMFLLSF